MTRRQIVATVVLPLSSLGLLALYLLLVQSRLPDPVAIHWGPGNEPDGFASPRSLVPLFGSITAALLALFTGLALNSSAAIGGRSLLGMANAAGWFMITIAVATTAVQLDGDNGAPLPGWSIPLAIAVGATGWLVAMWVAGPATNPTTTTAPGPAGVDRLDLAGTHTAVWHGRTPMGRGPIVAAAMVIGINLVIGALTSWWLAAIAAATVLAVLASVSYRITIGPGAIDVSGGFAGYPRVRLPLDQVTRADAGTISPWRYGGWGLRVRSKAESAVVTRSGPALVVTRTDGSTLSISLDDPDQAAATITTLLDRRSERGAARELDRRSERGAARELDRQGGAGTASETGPTC